MKKWPRLTSAPVHVVFHWAIDAGVVPIRSAGCRSMNSVCFPGWLVFNIERRTRTLQRWRQPVKQNKWKTEQMRWMAKGSAWAEDCRPKILWDAAWAWAGAANAVIRRLLTVEPRCWCFVGSALKDYSIRVFFLNVLLTS